MRAFTRMLTALFAVTTLGCSEDATRPILFLITNGGFESGDLTGWLDSTTTASTADTYVESGMTAPASGTAIPAPPLGTYWALFDQTGPALHILYQDVTIPAGYDATFQASIHLNNQADNYYIAPTEGLAHDGTESNQQFRIDVMNPGAPVDGLAGVLQNIYQTQPGDPLVDTFAVTADLGAFAGQTVRLRFASPNNQLYLLVGLDGLEVIAD